MNCPKCVSSNVSEHVSKELCRDDDSPSTWGSCLNCTRENKCHYTSYTCNSCGASWDDY
jgi:hypothetical protein